MYPDGLPLTGGCHDMSTRPELESCTAVTGCDWVEAPAWLSSCWGVVFFEVCSATGALWMELLLLGDDSEGDGEV
ncbi:hypothetical protein D3C85_1520590 [compost metagenome]